MSWIPFRRSMQRYCEPFFAAIEIWRNYESFELLENRISLIEMAYEILNKYSQNEDTYFFDLLYDNSTVSLLPEKFPTAGLNYKVNGDTEAYENAKKLLPQSIFNRVGVFFQTNLLKAMAGYSDSYMVTANTVSRKSILLSIEKLFRLPEEAGVGKFVFHLCNSKETNPTICTYKGQSLSASGKAFAQFLAESKNVSPDNSCRVAVSGLKRKASKNKRQSKIKSKKVCNNESSVIENWTTKHENVGSRVAAFFPIPQMSELGQVRNELFFGNVTKYLPESHWNVNDQLYHIVWEDGDEQDYDEEELKKGIALFQDNYGWITEHEAIGTEVATYIEAEQNSIRNKSSLGSSKVILKGTVIKVSLSLSEHDYDIKYFVKWENEETSIIQHPEFTEAVELFKTNNSYEGISWTDTHSSIGSSVAAFFAHLDENNTPIKKIYFGEITKYAVESMEGANDQLYHVSWEDGDEQDFDENEYRTAVELFKSTAVDV